MDGRNKKVYTGFWGNLNERPFGRLRHRWDNIKMDLQETVWGEGMDLVDLPQDTDK